MTALGDVPLTDPISDYLGGSNMTALGDIPLTDDIEDYAGGGGEVGYVAGAVAHYDASDTGSLTIVSNKVSQWNDLSGNGHNLSQGTAADRPLYNASPRTINGITIPEFTASGEWLDSTCPTPDRTASHYIAFVVDSFSGAGTLIGSQGGSDGFEARIEATTGRVQYLQGGVAFMTSHVGHSPRASSGLPQQVNFLCARLDASTLYQDLLGGSVFSPVANADTFTAGRNLRLGNDQSGTVPFDGLIAEYLFYDTKHTDAEMEQNFHAMVAKWID